MAGEPTQNPPEKDLREELEAWRQLADRRGKLIPHLERERAQLLGELDQWKIWARDGEQLAAQAGGSFLFSLGHWWADRPWRSKEQ